MNTTPPTGDLLLEARSDILDLIEHLAAASTQLRLAYQANDEGVTRVAISEIDEAATELCSATDLLNEIKNKTAQWRHWAAQSLKPTKP